jgi:hypothetical protein
VIAMKLRQYLAREEAELLLGGGEILDGASGGTGKMRVQFEGREKHVNVCWDGR